MSECFGARAELGEQACLADAGLSDDLKQRRAAMLKLG